MARQELIKGSFTGRVGSFVGSKNVGGDYIKARVFSKTPASEVQTSCLVAFGYLQRFSSVLNAKLKGFPFYRSKQQSFYNTITQTLKPCIAKHQWDRSVLAECFPTNTPLTVSVNVDKSESVRVYGSVASNDTEFNTENRWLFVSVLNEQNNAVFSEVKKTSLFEFSFFTSFNDFSDYWGFALEVIKHNWSSSVSSWQRRSHPYLWLNPSVFEM